MLQAEKGRHFDPRVVEMFVGARDAVEAIHKQSQGG